MISHHFVVGEAGVGRKEVGNDWRVKGLNFVVFFFILLLIHGLSRAKPCLDGLSLRKSSRPWITGDTGQGPAKSYTSRPLQKDRLKQQATSRRRKATPEQYRATGKHSASTVARCHIRTN